MQAYQRNCTTIQTCMQPMMFTWNEHLDSCAADGLCRSYHTQYDDPQLLPGADSRPAPTDMAHHCCKPARLTFQDLGSTSSTISSISFEEPEVPFGC